MYPNLANPHRGRHPDLGPIFRGLTHFLIVKSPKSPAPHSISLMVPKSDNTADLLYIQNLVELQSQARSGHF